MCAIVHRKGKKDRLSGDSLPLLRTLLWLSIPTVIEEVLATLLQYVDTAMVGQLGEQATASVSITTNVTWLVNSIPGAIGTAMLVLISRSEGAGQKEQVKKLAQQAFLLSLVFGLVLGGVSVLLSSRIPVWMGAEASIQNTASRYFFIISLPMVFRSTSAIMGAALRAVQNTKTPMLINVAANGANILFNYLFIYVLGYGVEGAAVASAISYVLAGVFMFLSCRKNELLRWEWKHFAPDAGLLRQCAAIGSAGAWHQHGFLFRLCGVRQSDFRYGDHCIRGPFHCRDGGDYLLCAGVWTAFRRLHPHQQRPRRRKCTEVKNRGEGEHCFDCRHDVHERHIALSRRAVADGNLLAQPGGGKPGRADAPPSGTVRAVFWPDGRAGRSILRPRPHSICLRGGKHRHVGRADFLYISCGESLGDGPSRRLVLHDR